MSLSLIVTYRQRENNLKSLLDWWKVQLREDWALVLVEVDAVSSSWIRKEVEGLNIQYVHLHCGDVFHKTKALNLGLSLSKGEFVAPFDVDLIPVGDTLVQHLEMAMLSRRLLITGYRVMCDFETIEAEQIPAVIEQGLIAPEDMPTALWKHLIRKERFGVVPLFKRSDLLDIGGWDEGFVGWGGEDQDMIERYLYKNKGYLCRCPELVYLHLAHECNQQWAESSLVEQNRKHYYAKIQARQKQL